MKMTIVLVALLLPWRSAVAHPASGIVVGPQGTVYFVYRGVMRIAADGTTTNIHPSRGGHWMALDVAGSFSRVQPRQFERVTSEGVRPALIFADGGAPIAVGRDGNLYYSSASSGEDPIAPGALGLTRMTPGGALTPFAPALQQKLAELKEGVTGLATGLDGSLYVASWSAVFRVNMDGTVAVVAQHLKPTDCDWDPPDHDKSNHLPCLRGLAVDGDGRIYAAATSCRRVLQITHDGRVSVVLRSEAPWSPTAVALRNGSIYVLEYTHANGPSKEGWYPRVRTIDPAGKVATLADLSPPLKSHQSSQTDHR